MRIPRSLAQLKRPLIVALLVQCAVSAFPAGNDWTLKDGGQPSVLENWVGTDGTTPCPAFDASDTYWLTKKRSAKTAAKSDETMPVNICLGSPAGRPYDAAYFGDICLKQQNKEFNVPLLTWYRGSIYANAQKYYSRFTGTVKVVQADETAYHALYINNNDRSLRFAADLQSDDAAPVVTIGKADDDYPSTYENMLVEGGHPYFDMCGDNSAYRGSFDVVDEYTPVLIGGTSVLGDGETPNPAAMTLCDKAAIAFTSDGSQPTGRGIRLVGEMAYLVAWTTKGNGSVCRYPISRAESAAGTLVKEGPGTVTLDCSYSAGTIEVAAGTLVLSDEAVLPAGQKIVVRSGATLESFQSLHAFDVTCDEGGSVVRKVLPIVVRYDAVLGTVETVSRPSSFALDEGVVQELALDTPVAAFTGVAPFDQSLALPVLKVATGAEDLDPSAFSDTSEKTYGLPTTWFTVVREDDGSQTVYLNAKPYAASLGEIPNTEGLNGSANWTSGQVPAGGWDYLLTHTMHTLKDKPESPFAGDSLTLGGDAIVALRNRGGITVDDLRAYGDVDLRASGGNNWTLSGASWLVPAVANERVVLRGNVTSENVYPITVLANIRGDGDIGLVSTKASSDIYETLKGDNSAWTGRMTVTCEKSSGYGRDCAGNELRFETAKNLGGAPASLVPDALVLARYSYLAPLGTAVLDTANRGITIHGAGGFNVPTGAVLTVSEQITVEDRGILVKRGAGVLALDGQVSAGNDSNLQVWEGGLKPLSPTCCAGLSVTFEPDDVAGTAELVIDTANERTLDCGLAVASIGVAEGKDLPVRLENLWTNGRQTRTVTVCTVGTEASDLRDKFRFIGHYKVESVERIAVEGVGIRYQATISPNGMALIFR